MLTSHLLILRCGCRYHTLGDKIYYTEEDTVVIYDGKHLKSFLKECLPYFNLVIEQTEKEDADV